ncbi:xanthine/uracil permease [Williamsoniiplasma somnilux]|uniref:Xanthine/uracil permease n=1 Tax=Williamsoniiplasma somnilux TaxID=215578 RepID=A0A2K8NY99_9MOLU|nr:NCS2 family permease [Williamsoniiplasma somnilux]ATZ18805.1 xanthine/uracil permease [Williamsoniiplasma somnilux]
MDTENLINLEANKQNKFANQTPEQTAALNAKNFKFSQNKAISKIQKYFKFDTLGSTFKKEIMGGLITFLAMSYILSVNPAIVSNAVSIHDPNQHMNTFGIFLATALTSFIGTFVIGIFANVPLAVSASMGLNAMFVFNIANGSGGIGYEGALIATMLSSIVFVILSVTPLRKLIINAIPKSLVLGVGIAIGFFISYAGISGMGWVAKSDGGLPIASLAILRNNYPMIIVGTFTFGLMLILHYKKVPGSAALAILTGFIIVVIVANSLPDNHWLVVDKGGFGASNFSLIGHGWEYDFSGFTLNIKNTWKEFSNPEIWNKPVLYISIFVVMFMCFFDATGTLAATSVQLNKRTNQHHEIQQKALIVDSASTVIAASLASTPACVYVESSAGIEQGARTGFASIITAFLFLSSIALFPIFKAIPQCVTSAALIFVGIMMITGITEIEWKKPEFSVAVFLTIMFMMVTYTIANGMAVGFIAYTFIMIVTGKIKQVPIAMWPLTAIFIAYFVATSFIQ